MVSAAATIMLNAPAERVWQVVSDLEGYSEWSPCFSQVYGELRSPNRLRLHLSGPLARPLIEEVSAVVLEVRRGRSYQLLLSLPHSIQGGDAPSEAFVVYEVELRPLGTGQVVVTQRLTGISGVSGHSADHDTLTCWLEEANAALRQRVEQRAVLPSHHQTAGTILVSSRHGRRHQLTCRRTGWLAQLAEFAAALPRPAAA